jgi:protein required for attachment to host cells
MKPIVTWVLIADGTQARVLENTGPGKGLSSVDGLEFSQEALQAQDIMSDRSGRSFSSVGRGRSAYEPKTDPVEHREAEFMKSVAATLEKKCRDGAFSRLIIAAAPIALGDIRKSLGDGVRKTIMAEIDKDLTNIPIPQLNKHLDGIIAV